jgi:hypothetical protein
MDYKTRDPGIYWLSATDRSPDGPDPFHLVHEELKSLSEYVREVVASENDVLTMAASHFFQQVRFPCTLLLSES